MSAAATLSTDTYLMVKVSAITPSPTNPRKRFDPASLRELAASIKAKGVEQPLVVRAVGEGWQLIHGERRWRAAQLAGVVAVPCVLRQSTDAEVVEAQLAEMGQSQDLSPLEKAQALHDYLEMANLSQKVLSQRLGLSAGTVSVTLAILDLPEPGRAAMGAPFMTVGHGRELARLRKKPEALEAVCKVLQQAAGQREVVGVRMLRHMVDGYTRPQPRPKTVKSGLKGKPKARRRSPVTPSDRARKALGELVGASHNLALGVNGLSRTKPVKVPAHLFGKAAKVLALLRRGR
jgi:ParB family chromosome partitioning protein